MKYVISHKHRFIYFVVQKVACTSIKTALLPLFDTNLDKRKDTLESGPSKSGVHKFFDQSGYQITKRQLVKELDGKYRDYFKFAFVRNPWDRLLSCYLNKLTEGGPGLKSPPSLAARVYPGMTFAEFVEVVSEVPDKEANIHFKSQCSVICGRGDDKPIMANFIGRFENLVSDFEIVMRKIGDDRVEQLPHLMHSKGRGSVPYTKFYDDRLRELVYRRYKDDIDIFGYSFE